MAQNDFVIADQTASAALSDINSALQSLASCSSGSSEPSVKYANMLWYDTTANILKIRNEANSAWISMLYVHQSDNAIHVLDNTYISDTSGNHVGLLGDQASSEWTTGTGTTESLVSPAKIAAAINAKVTASQVLGLTATASAGAVGTYSFLNKPAQTVVAVGETSAGSALEYGGTRNGADIDNLAYQGTPVSPSGTWRCMSGTSSVSAPEFQAVWLRIA